MTRALASLRCERGQGLVSALLLLAGVLVPLLFLVPLFARLELARLTVEQAARDAARSAAEAPAEHAATAAARAAIARAQAQSGLALRLTLAGRLEPRSTISAAVSTYVPLGRLPGLGGFGSVAIGGRASAPVDRFRSLRAPP